MGGAASQLNLSPPSESKESAKQSPPSRGSMHLQPTEMEELVRIPEEIGESAAVLELKEQLAEAMKAKDLAMENVKVLQGVQKKSLAVIAEIEVGPHPSCSIGNPSRLESFGAVRCIDKLLT